MNLIESAINSKNNQIIINTRGKRAVTGFLTENFSLSGSADWSPVMEVSSFQEKVKRFMQTIKVGKSNGLSVDYPIQSRKVWQKSTISEFSFKFVILAFNNTDNVLDKVKILLDGVYPISKGIGNKRSFYPPNGYNADLSKEMPTGTWKVTIGNRLISINKLIMKNIDFNISHKKLPNGKPLYVEVNVIFEPTEDVSIKDVLSWIGE